MSTLNQWPLRSCYEPWSSSLPMMLAVANKHCHSLCLSQRHVCYAVISQRQRPIGLLPSCATSHNGTTTCVVPPAAKFYPRRQQRRHPRLLLLMVATVACNNIVAALPLLGLLHIVVAECNNCLSSLWPTTNGGRRP